MPVSLVVALSGAAGAAARYGLDVTFRRDAHHVPWVTFVINVGGSFLLGAVVALLDAHPNPHPALRPAITIGLLGAFTTLPCRSRPTGCSTAVTSCPQPPTRSAVWPPGWLR